MCLLSLLTKKDSYNTQIIQCVNDTIFRKRFRVLDFGTGSGTLEPFPTSNHYTRYTVQFVEANDLCVIFLLSFTKSGPKMYNSENSDEEIHRVGLLFVSLNSLIQLDLVSNLAGRFSSLYFPCGQACLTSPAAITWNEHFQSRLNVLGGPGPARLMGPLSSLWPTWRGGGRSTLYQRIRQYTLRSQSGSDMMSIYDLRN